ncbi:hypothetical protein OBBRIDRAFT_801700 [Obba rivulosa]|uniref:CxC2-like cysteine cluster KDZ transposase-associated domain-containing protein n=1 Tax=Obba rivulosa TaxID=1052685 RepID=A0A8E2DQE5_9APHY|nr:hypothetical protein OBBRIDRAFT_801700 [Obba rivulosa]
MNLGHGGRKCAAALEEPRWMTIVHSHGLDRIGVCFCACLDDDLEGTPHALQLIRHGLWPGSWDKPVTAFTFEVLKNFHLLSLQSQLTAQDFHRYLQRRTNNVQSDEVARTSLCNAGVHLAAGGQARWVGTKPSDGGSEPGNPVSVMSTTWYEHGPALARVARKYAIFGSVVYNNGWQLSTKPEKKRRDPNDFALTAGSAYFADVDDFAKYQQHLGPLEQEVSTCHKFGAMGYGGYRGRVSGTVGLGCAQHMFVLPGGGVDLQKGERSESRFVNVNFAMISGLQRWMSILLIISGYDINCQYRKKLRQEDKMVLGKSRHLAINQKSHNASCRYKFSYYWMPGAAMTDGEALEQIWAVLNGLASRMWEMSAGHRHDIINDHHSDMNVHRVHGIARSLTAKHNEALTKFQVMDEELQKLESKLPTEKLVEWKRAKVVYLTNVINLQMHEGLENPYELKQETALSRKQVFADLTQISSTNECALEWRGLIGVLEEEIELQELRIEISEDLHDDGQVEELSDELHTKIEWFHSRFDIWQELHNLFFWPLLWEPGTMHTKELKKLNTVWIDLPSMFDRRIITCKIMKEVVEIEHHLREGQAKDALAEIYIHLITKYSLKKQQRELVGQVPMTTMTIWEDSSWLEDIEDSTLKKFILDAVRVHWF